MDSLFINLHSPTHFHLFDFSYLEHMAEIFNFTILILFESNLSVRLIFKVAN